MSARATSRVTPAGVKSGDRATLAAVCERRGPAVMAYCDQICPPSLATRAAADALGRFRAAVVEADRPGDIDPDGLLLTATRHAAAERAVAPGSPRPGQRFRRRQVVACQLMPALLVARSENELSRADLSRLERHLQRCPVCSAASGRFHAAEAAYHELPGGPLPERVLEALVRGMARAAPVRSEKGAAPEHLTESPAAQGDPSASAQTRAGAPAHAPEDEPGGAPEPIPGTPEPEQLPDPATPYAPETGGHAGPSETHPGTPLALPSFGGEIRIAASDEAARSRRSAGDPAAKTRPALAHHPVPGPGADGSRAHRPDVGWVFRVGLPAALVFLAIAVGALVLGPLRSGSSSPRAPVSPAAPPLALPTPLPPGTYRPAAGSRRTPRGPGAGRRTSSGR